MPIFNIIYMHWARGRMIRQVFQMVFSSWYHFVWSRHNNMSPCTGSKVNSNYERIASRVGTQFRTRASESQKHLPPPTVVSKVLTTRPWPTRQNGLASAEQYHTLNTTVSRFGAGMPFERGIHRSPMDSPNNGAVMGTFAFPFAVSLNKLLEKQWATQRTRDAVITSLLHQSDVAMSFWR